MFVPDVDAGYKRNRQVFSDAEEAKLAGYIKKLPRQSILVDLHQLFVS